MQHIITNLNNAGCSRALCAALMILPLVLSGCFDDKKTDPPLVESFDLAVSVTSGGSVSSSPAGIDCGSDCVETLTSGNTITLSATPASGAMFTGWGGDCSGSTPSCTLTMSASRAVTASFTFITDPPPPAAQYTLSVSVTGTGTVSSSPAGISCGVDCTENYADGTSVTLTATAGTSFQFSSWSGACSGTGSCVVAMTEARSVTATFSTNPPPAAQYTLSVSVTGTGSVSSTPAGISCGADCTENYTDGTSVTLTATAGTGFQFSSWSGACTGTGSCMVAMTEARSVTASFSANPPPVAQYTLSVSVTGTGNVSSTPAGISCGADCTENYADGTSVTLIAAPGTGFQFSSWSGACSGTGSCVVAMSEARSVSASFMPVLRALTVTIDGSGSVTSSPAGITCGTDCSESYTHGSNVTLTATPGANQQFSGWLRACSGTQTTCTVAMTEARRVTAAFAPITTDQFTLTISVTGTGTVTSTPAGINCGVDCSESYSSGTHVKLTATAGTGYLLSSWGGACSGSRACVVPMNANRAVTVIFSPRSQDLILFDNFEYEVNRNDPNAAILFQQRGPWTGVKTEYKSDPSIPSLGGANGFLYTAPGIPGYSDDFPGGASDRVLAMEARPGTEGSQTDFYLEYGDGQNPAYDNTIPGNVWFQFWIYINNFGDQQSQLDGGNKFIYPCNSSYPCNTGKWLISMGGDSYLPHSRNLGMPSSTGAYLVNYPQIHSGAGAIVNDSYSFYDRWKLGQENISQHMMANRWTLVKIHIDTSTASGRYEAWMKPLDGQWVKTTEWISGFTEGFSWTINSGHIGGHRIIRIPTTIGSGTLERPRWDAWIYMDDFAMARSEAALPQYSDLP